MQTFGFTHLIAQRLVAGLANKTVLDEELNLIAKNNINWITIADDQYPKLLREIYLPPMVLYFQGDLPNNMQTLFAVVGARKADSYGQYIIDALIPDLVAAKYTIVSGGALGLDAMAHAATIKSGGKTVAVLGSGLLKPYPRSNRPLFKAIVEYGGAVVSSFPLRMEALPGNFPARNRIVTGLSRGCLVVQAAKKSGALISADYAMEQGREVFAIPGSVANELSEGCNALIQKGAKLVMGTVDILEEFGDRLVLADKQVMEYKVQQLSLELAVEASAKKSEKPIVDKYATYSDVQKKIIAVCKHACSFDSILNNTQLSSETVQSELFNLQLDGVVSQDFTGMWIVS
jgi:DNA processing protein